jgi:hypothetical protein
VSVWRSDSWVFNPLCAGGLDLLSRAFKTLKIDGEANAQKRGVR